MWKFQEVLNQDLAIMLVITTGFFSVWRAIIFRKEDMRVFNMWLFKATLPASVIMGLGIKTDLYDEEIWRFVGAFLMMRAITLVVCALFFGLVLRRSLGEVTANWLSTTWISTVILGTPLLRALLGPSYASLGVVAGISSFIFQLPIMLVLFEVHTWRQENLRASLPEVQQALNARPSRTTTDHSSEQAEAEAKSGAAPTAGQGQRVHPERLTSPSELAPAGPPYLSAADASTVPHQWAAGGSMGRLKQSLVGCLQFKMTRKQGQRLALRLLMNHVLWGVAIGIILSLSKIGPKWLDPGTLPACPNCTYAVGAGFIFLFLEYLSRCTEPVAFFATGMWMHRPNPLACGWFKAVLYMVVKLVLVPMLMVGLPISKHMSIKEQDLSFFLLQIVGTWDLNS